MGIAPWVEHWACDWKVTGLSLGRSGRGFFFFLQGQLSVDNQIYNDLRQKRSESAQEHGITLYKSDDHHQSKR